VDTSTLASRLRELLSGNPPAPRPNTPAPDVKTLRLRFLRQGADLSREFLESLTAHLDSERMASQLHDWAGNSETLELPAIAKLARCGQQLLAQPPLRTEALRECLTDLHLTFVELLPGEDAPAPDAVLQALRGKRIALVGLPADRCDAICAALARVEARPLLFSHTDELESQSIRECDLTILHVEPGMDAERLSTMAAGAGAGPLLLAGERSDLMNLAPGMQALAAGYLGAWEPDEVLMRLALATSQATRAAAFPSPGPEGPQARLRGGVTSASVLLADDDPIVLTLLSSLLQNYGMQCQTAGNGQDALRVIRETKPHVAVLDVSMPELDGYAVLSAIRADRLPTLVVMLSARQQESDIVRGFQLGADDYLVKPFSPLELVARLKRLLRQEVDA
jgi:CheY-like chemotaxis protein/HPt (histidine-containing phosphotransfer) domain-containing protein